MRFERSDSQSSGVALFSRSEVNARLGATRALDRGEFLARLWAHFGPAAPRQGGFEYHLRDRATGLDFAAYAGTGGPGYGGNLDQRKELLRVIESLEKLLDTTEPVACAIAYAAGEGTHVLGWKDGRTFDVPDRRKRKPALVDRRAPRARP